MGAVVPEGASDPAATPPQSVRLLNLPNALTMFRLAVVPLFAVLLLSDGGLDDERRVWATVFFAGAIITDRYDGMIARRTGQVTEFGKLADPIADKALTGTALIGLSVLGLLPWWVTVVILVREVGVTVLRFWVIRHGVIAASRGGKAKTVLQALAIGLYILPVTGFLASARWWVMGAALVLTVVTGIDYVYRALTLRRTSARAMAAAAARRAAGTGTTEPRSVALAPGTVASVAQNSPAVSVSAAATVSPRSSSAVPVSALSAIGSASLPNSVTWLVRRAIMPS